MKKKVTAKPKRAKRSLRVPKWVKAPLIILWPLRPLGRYFAGAWHELRQVNWPSNRTTAKLTLAVILFTAIMTLFIVTLDYGFEQIVKRILL